MSATTLLSESSNCVGGDSTKAFAILIPKSPSAEQAFDEVVSTVMQDPDAYQHAMQFIHAIPPSDGARTQYSVQDYGAGRVQEGPAQLWTGAYKFDLQTLSSKKTSWLLGLGPSSAARASTHPVDLILAPKTNAWCQKSLYTRHAEISFSHESYSLMIEPTYRVAITGPLGYQELQDEPCVVLHGTTIHFGDCIYKVEFTSYAESFEFKEDLTSFMMLITKNRSRLHKNLTIPSARHRRLVTMGRYMFSPGAIASGSFGHVYAGYANDGCCVAVKRFLRPDREKFGLHATMMQKVGEHANVIRLLEFIEDFDSPMPGLYAFYQPLVNCSLAAKLNEPREPSTRLGYTPKIPHDAQMYLLRDWLRGLDHLHTAKGMMHRDINPNNLGIIESNPPRGVILDLDSVTDETHSYEHALGTLPYMAPELIDIRLWHEQATSEQRENFYENVHYDTAVDIWSLGFSLWTMIKTKAPSWSVLDPPAEREPGQKANTAYVTQGRYNTWRTMLARTRNNRDMSDHCQLTLLHLCEQMMQWDSDDRPTAADLLKQIEAYMKGYQYHTG